MKALRAFVAVVLITRAMEIVSSEGESDLRSEREGRVREFWSKSSATERVLEKRREDGREESSERAS